MKHLTLALEPIYGPLQEQYLFLTTEQSLQPPHSVKFLKVSTVLSQGQHQGKVGVR